MSAEMAHGTAVAGMMLALAFRIATAAACAIGLYCILTDRSVWGTGIHIEASLLSILLWVFVAGGLLLLAARLGFMLVAAVVLLPLQAARRDRSN